MVINTHKLKRPSSGPEIDDLDGRFNGLGTGTEATWCIGDVSMPRLVHGMCTTIESEIRPLRGQDCQLGSRQLL